MPTPEQLTAAMNPQAGTPAGGLDIMAMIRAMQQQQAQQPNLAILAQVLNAPRGHHYGIGGGEISDANPLGNAGGDPFSNGFFQNHAPMLPTNVLGGSSPQDILAFNPVAHPIPQTPVPSPIAFGQGMINPQLPDAAKYQDPNFWSASPNINPLGWLPGATVRDEAKQYAAAKSPKRPFSVSARNRPAFSF